VRDNYDEDDNIEEYYGWMDRAVPRLLTDARLSSEWLGEAPTLGRKLSRPAFLLAASTPLPRL
jgi:hypothetical protein